MTNIRRQLSLFLPIESASIIESVRKVVDPVQFSLIPAHVTLCREHELEDIHCIEQRIKYSPISEISLTFGKPERFYGHGIIMKCLDGEKEFRELREYLVNSRSIGDQKPHLTLAHPRNKVSKENDLDRTEKIPFPYVVTLKEIRLIQQAEMSPWGTLKTYKLGC